MKLAGKILLTLLLVLLIGALLLPVLGYGLVFVGLTNAVNLNYTDSGQEDCYLYLTRDEKTNTSHIAPADSGKGDIAITIATPFLVSGGRTLAQVEIKTGRTHQIRCQASYHHHPLTGDAKYHGSHNEAGYYLHSSCIIAEGRVITGTPGEEFTAAVAVLLKCPEEKVKTAVRQIISSFAKKNNI